MRSSECDVSSSNKDILYLWQVIQEYQILSDHSLHPNIPVLYGAFRCPSKTKQFMPMLSKSWQNRCGPHIWLSMELCGSGSVADLSAGLVERGRLWWWWFFIDIIIIITIFTLDICHILYLYIYPGSSPLLLISKRARDAIVNQANLESSCVRCIS